jgi:hypothetical protein
MWSLSAHSEAKFADFGPKNYYSVSLIRSFQGNNKKELLIREI